MREFLVSRVSGRASCLPPQIEDRDDLSPEVDYPAYELRRIRHVGYLADPDDLLDPSDVHAEFLRVKMERYKVKLAVRSRFGVLCPESGENIMHFFHPLRRR